MNFATPQCPPPIAISNAEYSLCSLAAIISHLSFWQVVLSLLAKMIYSLAMTNYLISPSVLSDKNIIHRLDKTGTVDCFIFILPRAVSTCP